MLDASMRMGQRQVTQVTPNSVEKVLRPIFDGGSVVLDT